MDTQIRRVWVTDVNYTDFVAADKQGGDYEGLATKLLKLLFKTELSNPDEYCCIPSKGKEVLDQEKLRGIRCEYIYCCVNTYTF